MSQIELNSGLGFDVDVDSDLHLLYLLKFSWQPNKGLSLYFEAVKWIAHFESRWISLLGSERFGSIGDCCVSA